MFPWLFEHNVCVTECREAKKVNHSPNYSPCWCHVSRHSWPDIDIISWAKGSLWVHGHRCWDRNACVRIRWELGHTKVYDQTACVSLNFIMWLLMLLTTGFDDANSGTQVAKSSKMPQFYGTHRTLLLLVQIQVHPACL